MRSKHTQETKDKILQLWNANMSAQRIADRFGITKNTVIAMIRTMRKKGLHVRTEAAPNKNPYKRPRSSVKKKKEPRQVTVYSAPFNFRSPNRAMKSKERWVPLLHLDDNTCRFTKDGKLFCNATSGKNSYCEEHAPIMGSGYHAINVNLRQLTRR